MQTTEDGELMHVKTALGLGQAGCQSSDSTQPSAAYEPHSACAAVNAGPVPMAFNPVEAPVYGGELLVINLGHPQTPGTPEEEEEEEEEENSGIASVSEEDELYLVLEGRMQTHVVTMKHTQNLMWQAPIPGHDCAEKVYLSVIRRSTAEHFDCVAVGDFEYTCDSAYSLAQFLLNSVNDPNSLEDVELIRSDEFDLANEIFSTLDQRLCAAFRHIQFPEGWHHLGLDMEQDDSEPDCRETLLHLAGRLGLHDTALYLLGKPGSEDALGLINHEGRLPCAVAADNRFDDIAELFSGYNTNGMVTQFDEQLDTEAGIIRCHGNAGTSLTTVSGAAQNRPIEASIEELREMEATMKRGRSPGLRRQYQTDWPSPPLPPRRPHNAQPFYDDQDPSAEAQVVETMERIFQGQRSHSHTLGSMLEEYHHPYHSAEGEARDRGQPPSSSTPYSGLNLSSEVMMEASRQYGILEGSLSSVRSINDGLLRLRGTQLLQKRHSDLQHVRRQDLSRFSISCPSLDAQARLCPLSPIHEGDQHKSMLDLAQEVGRSPLAGQSPAVTLDDGFIAPPDYDTDGTVRICVNGVTIDSTEDSVRRGSVDGDVGAVRLRRSGRLSRPRDEDIRRRSWCPDSPRVHGGDGGDAVDGGSALQARILAMNGKSMSLCHLDCEVASDDDSTQRTSSPRDGHQPGETSPHFGDSLDTPGERTLSGGSEEDLSYSPVDSDGSSPTVKDLPDGQEVMRQLNAEMTSASPQAAHSMNDLSSPQMSNRDKKTHQRSMSGMHGVRSYEEERGKLGVPHSNMTKSLSTPSIPAATAEEQRTRGFHKDSKQPSDLLVQKVVEDLDAKFRRQAEIEEVEEEGATVDKGISWKEFLTDDATAGDSDEKSKQAAGVRKEEKKQRKPNVFTRFQNSYRTKKHKDKDGKVKQTHRFVAVSFSNATACHVCHKPMANKPALRCENCLINVHEHNCKDQVSSCEKNSNMKVLQREGSAPAAMVQDKQTASLQGSSLRPSHSFKLKDRSSSAPSKTQAMTSVPHRHSVPSTGKAINESDETDGMGHDVGPSNITDTISVSLESLDAVIPSETHFLEEEPDLMLGVEEQETWSATVDRKTLKKMTDKDVRRQDTIWELIQTEKQYVKRLKIMQKLLRDPMLTELGLTLDQTERLFPRLDELFELHAAFLRSLLALQTINEDRSVDEIGLTLLKQFADTTADRMKSIYGVFCSKHTEAIQLYKEIAKTDRKFQNFCRKTCNLPVCEKREVPDLILGVTVRLSKYPILIETIFKRTKDKKDREQLSQALQHSKVVVNGVDAQVASYEKLMDIYRAFDSRTTMYQNKKFKRQDLMSPGRRLLHAGHIGWKTARSRVIDIYTVVLTDIMVFLQKNEQKYTFFLQDNKSCVVPLNKLLVREKRDERDSHGIYVISQNKTEPEMYELVCRTRDDRDNWLKILQDAIKSSPEEEEIQQQQTEVVVPEEERRKQEEKSKKVKDIIDQLHQRDSDIKTLCEQKNHLMLELMEFSAMREDGTNSRPSSQYDLNGGTSQEVVQAAMQEASRLTTILQGPGSQLSRSVSSAGEHVSMSYVNVPMPKRAETFAGFDTSFEAPKSGALLKKRFIQQYGDEEGRCPSDLSLHNADTIPEDSVISTDSRFGSQPGLSPQSLPSSSNSSLPRGSPQAWDTSPGEGEVRPGMDISDHGSMGELSVSSVSSLQQPAQPTSAEQMLSVVQLVKYLHNLMNLTAKQTTTVECLRAELGEAKEEITKLSQDMHGQRRSGSVYRHNQLEELRNIQENIRREREEWEREKEKELEFIRQEKNKLDIHKRMLDKNESELRSKKDDLWRQREALQRQIDMMRDQGLLNTLTDTDHVVHTIDLDSTPSSSSTDPHLHTDRRTPPGHRRSASADFNHRAPPSQAELEKLAEQRGMPRHARGSVTSLQNYPAGPPPAGGGKQNVPLHLMSTRNEQRMGGSNMQKLPMKLSSSSLKQQPQQQQQQGQQHMHPRTASLSSLGARPGGGTSPVAATPTPQQAQGMITKNQNSRSTPSNLAMVMKLAEPGAKGKGSGGQGGGGGQSGPGAPRPPSEGSPDKVIYF